MDTSGKRRQTLAALVVVVAALVCVSGVMAYRTTHQGKQTQAKPTVHYSPPTGDDDHHEDHQATSSGTGTAGSGTSTTKQRDSDNDGVPNSADACPYKPGKASNRGCPVVTTTQAS